MLEAWEAFENLPRACSSLQIEYRPVASHVGPVRAQNEPYKLSIVKLATYLMLGR